MTTRRANDSKDDLLCIGAVGLMLFVTGLVLMLAVAANTGGLVLTETLLMVVGGGLTVWAAFRCYLISSEER